MSNCGLHAAVVGWPVTHSRSPMIHGYWLKHYGIAGTYDRRPVAPEEAEHFFADLAAQGLDGCNVTVPHKETAFAALDAAHGAARRLKAANTLWLEDGRLHGDNTDLEGFLANLDEGAPDWLRRDRAAVVLGAGGAARAIVAGLNERGIADLRIVNRTPERASALLADLAISGQVFTPGEVASALEGAALLVNTTSLGMDGDDRLPVAIDALPRDAVVNDAVYVPLMTPLLQAAAARGNKVVDGLGMLLHQAVPGFERWFGVRPQVSAELRALVIADLEAH